MKDHEHFLYELDKPLPGMDGDSVSDSDVDSEMSGFASLFASVGGGQNPTG